MIVVENTHSPAHLKRKRKTSLSERTEDEGKTHIQINPYRHLY